MKDNIKQEIKVLEAYKTEHELPNSNTYEYNYGYVKAMNTVINRLKNL